MKQLLVLLFLLCTMSVSAQDVIVKKDGSTVVCRVVEVTGTEITYKKWSDLNGSNYVMDKSLASSINYESGKKETFGEMENQYKPNNQNYGVQQYNDRALLKIDNALNYTPKTTKVLRIIGIVSGALGIGVATYALIDNGGDSEIAALAGAGGGLVLASGFIIAGNLYKKHYNEKSYTSSIYQHNFQFANGSSLSAGIDMLSDRSIGSNTFGLGLRYNF